jgi:hypothetical protein
LAKTWPVTRREEHRSRVFEIEVLRAGPGPKAEDVTGDWRQPDNEELQSLQFNQINDYKIKHEIGGAHSMNERN